MKYKVGDKVRVRGDLEVLEKYGDSVFAASMERYKNENAVIKKVYADNRYDLDIDEAEWYWTDEMLRPAEFKIWCETVEEKQAVLEELEKEGYRWKSGAKPTEYKNGIAKPMMIYAKGNSLTRDWDKRPCTFTPSEFTGIDFSEKITITKTSTGATATYGDKTVTTEGDFEDVARQALAEVLCPFKVGDRVLDKRCKNKGIVKEIRINGEVVVHLDSADGDYDMTFKTLELLELCTEPSYNAKLFCIEGSNLSADDYFKKGYIYEVKNGRILGYECTGDYKDIEHVNNVLVAQFMEVKGGLDE